MKQTGKTTRLVDRYIQELFKNGFTHVYQGRNTDKEVELTEKCFAVFKNRMKLEHNEISFEWKYSKIDGIWCYKVKLSRSEANQHS